MWWLSLKAGDTVYVPMERDKQSGLAKVYSSGKKYIHISLHGTPIRVRKSDGCVEDYPYNQICRDEKDHMDSVWQRKRFRDAVSNLERLVSSRTRVSKNDVDELESLLVKLTGL